MSVQVEFRGSKVFRNGVLVGAVWPFRGAWFSRVFAESPELGSCKFHCEDNARADATVRAQALSEDEAAPKNPKSIIPMLEVPEAFSD